MLIAEPVDVPIKQAANNLGVTVVLTSQVAPPLPVISRPSVGATPESSCIHNLVALPCVTSSQASNCPVPAVTPVPQLRDSGSTKAATK